MLNVIVTAYTNILYTHKLVTQIVLPCISLPYEEHNYQKMSMLCSDFFTVITFDELIWSVQKSHNSGKKQCHSVTLAESILV